MVKMGENKDGTGENTSGMEKNVGIGESSVAIGESNVGMGEMRVGSGEINVGIGEINVGMGDNGPLDIGIRACWKCHCLSRLFFTVEFCPSRASDNISAMCLGCAEVRCSI